MQGKLGQLRDLLASELRSQLGEEVELFHDVGAIPYGAEWDREILHAINKANFFIPIVTPRFLRSHWCNREVELFLERQNTIFDIYPSIRETSRIFPIHYIDISDIEPTSPDNLNQITKRQYMKFSHLRLKDYRSEVVMTEIEKFAADIRKLLLVKVPRLLTAAEIAEQQRKAAEEALLREAENQRLADERRRQEKAAAALA